MRKPSIFGISLIFFAVITILAASCGKTGPVGPAGSTGATGAQGSAGPQGPQGNANVQVDTFTLTNAQWLWNDNYIFYTSQGSYTEWFTRYYKTAFSQVTQGVLDSGMVLAYMTPNLGDQNQWSPLPYVFDTGAGYSYNFVYVTSPGNVELEFFITEEPNATNVPVLSTFDITSYKFKIIAVTGSLATSMQQHQIDVGDYGQVANFLKL